jgi:uncharacterized protein (TIGR02452 family)
MNLPGLAAILLCMYPKRTTAAEQAREIVRIIGQGQYESPTGVIVRVADQLERARGGTVTYPPGELPGASALTPQSTSSTRYEVVMESTLSAAARLVGEGHRAVALNFASAKNPGGGFLNGARAQEESLCRESLLYACLNGNPMYDFHRTQADLLYSDYAIYSPDVPVVRSPAGELLAQPYPCSFITSPAANAKEVLRRDATRGPEIRQAMQARVHKVLVIAAAHGHDAIVLGAWGCGVFGNDCTQIAELFHATLTTTFRDSFARIAFAVLDSSPERRFIGPFERMFA